MLNLESIKSACPIEDQGELHELLKSRMHQSPQTSFAQTKNGEVKIMKGSQNAAPRSAADVSIDELQKLVEARGMAWEDGYAGRALAYWASDERVDAHTDIVRQNWLFNEFEGNSPMPFSHDWGGLPVGRALDWEVQTRKDADYDGDALWLLGLFATAEQYGFADSVYRLAAAAILPGGSVGFWSERAIRVEDPKEREKLGLGQHGLILDQNHLLEYSPTLLGANPGALGIYQNAKSRNLLEPQDFRVVRELRRQQIAKEKGAGDLDAWRAFTEEIRSIQKLVFPKSTFEKHDALDQPFEIKGEDESLRGLVPVAEKTLDQRVDDLQATVEAGLMSLASIAEDIRETVEELKERPSEVAETKTGDGEPLSAAIDDRAKSLLARLDAVNT